MTFKVTKQFGSGAGREQSCGQFKTADKAKVFAIECAESDAAMKIQTIYRIYDFDDLVGTITSNDVQAESKPSESSGSQGQKSGASFRPSPLQTAPRPSGMPANNWVEPDEDDKKSK